MRQAPFTTLCVALLLGACTPGGEDEAEHAGETEGEEGEEEEAIECDQAQSMRVDAILALAGDTTAGVMVFNQTCGAASCHGADGVMGPAPDLSEEASEFDDQALTCLLLTGYEDMPPQAILSDQQLADVLAYVRATF